MSLDFTQYLILILIGLLFFKEQMIAWLSKWFKRDNDEAMVEAPPEWAKKLTNYYNHDTTSYHKATQEKLGDLLKMEEKEHEANEKLRDTLVGINNALQNLEKYGVKCRHD